MRFPVVSSNSHLWEAVLWPQVKEPITGVLSHDTALRLHELCDVNPPNVHITLPRAFRLRRAAPAWLVIHNADLTPEEITRIDGLPVTAVARTLADIAAGGASAKLHDALRDARARSADP